MALALGSSLSVMAAGPSESLATLYPDFQVASIQYLDFTDHNRDEAVVTGRIFGHPYEPSHIGAIMAYDDATQGWKPLYVTERCTCLSSYRRDASCHKKKSRSCSANGKDQAPSCTMKSWHGTMENRTHPDAVPDSTRQCPVL